MNSVDTNSKSAIGSPSVKPGEFRLEVIVVPVSDVDRAKQFYDGLGWRFDAEAAAEDGYRLISQVRALPADGGGQVPAVALTAYARVEDRTRALTAGFNMHVAKPVEPSELLSILSNLVTLTPGN